MVDAGYLYIIAIAWVADGIYKVGKTINMKSTISSYKRQGNIKHDSIYITDNLSYAETLILNILGPHRTRREDRQKISEQVQMPLDVVIEVIKYVVEWVKFNGKSNDIKLSRSTKTLAHNRKLVPVEMWDGLCKQLNELHRGFINIPMEVDGEDVVPFSLETFDNFLEWIKKIK